MFAIQNVASKVQFKADFITECRTYNNFQLIYDLKFEILSEDGKIDYNLSFMI